MMLISNCHYEFLQDFGLENHMDQRILKEAEPVLNGTTDSVTIDTTIHNEVRAFGSTLSYHIAL